MHSSHTFVEVSKKAFDHNVAQYRRIIGKGLLAAVVKSNAYGHGLLEVGSLCQSNKQVDWLCVAMLSEALLLRQNGVDKPILVLSCVDVDLALAVGKNIEFMVESEYFAGQLNDIGSDHGEVFNVHIKIDTGLSRFGVMPHEAEEFIKQLNKLSHIKINGISTHFAQSQSECQLYTHAQMDKFELVLRNLSFDIPIKHAANSAATGVFDMPLCNLFRIGIGIYGYWASRANKRIIQRRYPDLDLMPVLTWKTRIIAIKRVDIGTPVGYNGTFTAKRNTILALLPIGYYDGYSPTLSNKTFVRIGNSKAPVVGRIAMNVVMVDITDIDNVHIGNEVVVLGDYSGVSACDLAIHSEINNERFVTTNINARIARIIIE